MHCALRPQRRIGARRERERTIKEEMGTRSLSPRRAAARAREIARRVGACEQESLTAETPSCVSLDFFMAVVPNAPMKRKKKTGRGMSRALLREELHTLARNLWWSWDSEARDYWERVASATRVGRLPNNNPVELLNRLDAAAYDRLRADTELLEAHQRIYARFQRECEPARSRVGQLTPKRPVAYFSMEFAVHESLPIYAGGLGVLAGDHAKTASDRKLPFVGLGLYYRRGYFRQVFDKRGKQKVVQKPADWDQLPLVPLRKPGSRRETLVSVELPDRVVQLRVWVLNVGRVQLYLLDPDVPANSRKDRELCHRLYSISREERIQQEILLGIGGVRLLEALGIEPGVWHLNEGHVAFMTLERLRQLRGKLSLSAAIEAIAADTVFTTHTPVPEGNEVFELDLARTFLAGHAEAAGIPIDEYLALGCDEMPDGHPVLSMTVLAMRFSRLRNGVSKLHGEVSRGMWQHLWPGFAGEETPVGSVTNGVHMRTWIAPEADQLFRRQIHRNWGLHLCDRDLWQRQAARLPNNDLWAIKRVLKERLIRFVRDRETQRLRQLGATKGKIEAAANLLDPDALTIGFARRFALYKRADLFFHDLARAARILGSSKRPVQLLFAGKPHPEDPAGTALCERIGALSRRTRFRGRVVLLENYDMEIGRLLVQGVDVWLNNPRRPLEASGTSGQKVPLNIGLNCSILDGWWCEGFSPTVGWCFGKPQSYDDPKKQDNEDSRPSTECWRRNSSRSTTNAARPACQRDG